MLISKRSLTWEKQGSNLTPVPAKGLEFLYLYIKMIATCLKRSFTPVLVIAFFCIQGCKKDISTENTRRDAALSFTVNGMYNGSLSYQGINLRPVIRILFSEPITTQAANAIIWQSSLKENINLISKLTDLNKVLEISPVAELSSFSSYHIIIPADLQTGSGGKILNPLTISLTTGLDEKDKFARISDDELLTLIQKQTFKYFWDFAHPNSGMARERNTSGDIVTSGGTGFGLMGMVSAVSRNFIGRADALVRLQKIVSFLQSAQTFHGAFPHWINGNTGRVQPFSVKDNGADIVETSFLMQGLLVVKQYFSANDDAEAALRADITKLYHDVEWDWFMKNGEDKMYWHWSPDYNWDINLPVKGWNESLMVYVLAASSPTHSISKSVYDAGWAGNGSIRNGSAYYGVQLPLGPANGGPLFFEHYSMMALNPFSLTDTYANYEIQAIAHSKINYNYCVANPLKYAGYSADCWGLTASDIQNGYAASSPSNDKGYIAPTAAISSLPYTPQESIALIIAMIPKPVAPVATVFLSFWGYIPSSCRRSRPAPETGSAPSQKY